MQAPKRGANPGRESQVLQEYGEEEGGIKRAGGRRVFASMVRHAKI
jgi:hypothetical protein